MKIIENQDATVELEILKTDFHGNFNADQLASELHLVRTIFKGSKPVDFRDICKTLQAVDKEPNDKKHLDDH